MSTAIYAGTLDPITIGHLSIIEQASASFDKVIVLIADNPDKSTSMFTFEERKDMIERTVAHLKNVEVDILKGGYTIHYAERVGATAIIRGLRDEAEFTKERQEFFTFNNYENPKISTVFLMSPPSIVHISSSFVKKNCYGISGWLEVIDKYVPLVTKEYLMLHYLREIYEKHFDNMDPFQMLCDAYSTNFRHHHDIAHIINMHDELVDFFRYTSSPKDRQKFLYIATIATLFHDFCIESDPKPPKLVNHFGHDAQQVSFDKFKHYFFPHLYNDGLFSDQIKEAIFATSHTEDNAKHPEHINAIVDADLAIFGQSPEVYAKYTAGIRQEYTHITSEKFTAGRIKLIQKFLARKHIYRTDFFRDKYESRARENLTRELHKLQNG